MNIFVVDEDPEIAAQSLCDKHVVKMILESAQMLCTCMPLISTDDKIVLYKPAFKNHPCTVWARESQQNYSWLCAHAKALCSEYTRRYKKTHKSEAIIDFVIANKSPLPDIGLTPFAQAMPDQYKDSNTVIAYRNYYLGEKKRLAVWKYSNPPTWWV